MHLCVSTIFFTTSTLLERRIAVYTAASHGFSSFLELHVHEMEKLKLDEINFFLTQSLAESDQDLRTLQAFRFELARFYNLSQLLDSVNEKLDLEQVNKYQEQMQKSWEASGNLYASLTEYASHLTQESGKVPQKDVPPPYPTFHDRG